MSVKDYATTVFKLANNSLETNKQYSWLVSCIAHTMKRFSNSIKLLQINDFMHNYCCLCFSLLANCTELELAGEYYKAICTIFLSPFVTEECIQAKEKIKVSLLERPETIDHLKKTLKNYKLDSALYVDAQDEINLDEDYEAEEEDREGEDAEEEQEGENEQEGEELNEGGEVEEDYLDEIEEPNCEPEERFQNNTIKSNSPFNKFFKDIRDRCQNEITNNLDSVESKQKNPLYSSKYIDHLENKFMPYFFIWGGIVLKGTNMTRITNGVLESYQGFLKKKNDKDVLPHRHLITNYETVNGLTCEYLESIANEKKGIKRKIQELSPDDGFAEKNPTEATENWEKGFYKI